MIAAFGGYQIYRKNHILAQEKADRIQAVEEKYTAGAENIIKL